MAQISAQSCLEISKPLEPFIGPLRESLRGVLELCEHKLTDSYETETGSDGHSSDDHAPEVASATQDHNLDEYSRAIIACLITGLLLSCEKDLPYPKSTGTTIKGELTSLITKFNTRQIGAAPFLPLMKATVDNLSDIEIWELVLHLIDSLPQPRTSTTGQVTSLMKNPSFGETPRKTNSNSLRGPSETRDLLEDALREEYKDCSFVDVEGFFEKYFEGKRWSSKWEKVFDVIKSEHVDGRWSTLPSPLQEQEFWNWLSNLQDKHLGSSRSKYCTTKSWKEMDQLSGKGQLDVFAKHPDHVGEKPHNWANVRVVGEHTSSSRTQKFWQIARYARNVFNANPRRLFLPGFTLKDSEIELYMFDSSGVYCAEPFDIHKNPERFIQVMVGYCWMEDEELGFDTFVEQEGNREFISMPIGDQGEANRLEIEKTPLFPRKSAVGRCTNCYRTIDGKAVVKFSWRSAQNQLYEADLLQQASDKGVKGVVKMIGHQELAKISSLRSGLKFLKVRQLKGRDRKLETLASFTSRQLATVSSIHEPSSGEKRRLDDEQSLSSKEPRSKKSRFSNEISGSCQGHKAKELNAETGSQGSQQRQEEPKTLYVDRVLSCVVLKPAGRSLAEFHSIRELVVAFRDAIKAHCSLFLKGRILHRDISSNNIIIANPEETEGYSGILIDMDLSTIIDTNFKNTRTNSQRITGTLKYMAIQVIEIAFSGGKEDLAHTYRHDLESFLYVFLSICANHDRKAKWRDPFEHWYTGTHANMVANKSYDMRYPRFQNFVLKMFSPKLQSLKGLALDVRDALFSKDRERLLTGTPQAEPSVLYKKIIKAFDRAIKQIEILGIHA